MSYFKVLGFEKEPFSTSPDPDFFYFSREHKTAFTKTLIEISLKRGLSVILGDVGTGKTTLSRKLIQELTEREEYSLHMVLDPSFENEHVFLRSLARNFGLDIGNSKEATILDFKESIERFLFHKTIAENKTVILIVDEAQKLNDVSLEVLRGLLNFETNEFKLLQLVLLGQMELLPKVLNIQNFVDRISLKYTLFPLSLDETKEMIEFRIRQAGYRARMQLFLNDAVKEIYDVTQGYPRRITMLCHNALKELVMRNKPVIDAGLIEELVHNEMRAGWHREDLLSRKNSY